MLGIIAAFFAAPWVIVALVVLSASLVVVFRRDGVMLVLILALSFFRTSRLETQQLVLEKPTIVQAKCVEVRVIGKRDFGIFKVENSPAGELENQRILVELPRDVTIHPPVRVTCLIQEKETHSSANFDQEAWFRREGWSLKASLIRLHHLSPLPQSGTRITWQHAHDRISSLRISGFSKRLARALVLGEGRALEKKDREPFARTGTAHVLAVSGLHVGLFYVLLKQLSYSIASLRSRRLLFLFFSGISLFFLARWTGHSPSVVRACLMFFFWECSTQLERDRYSLNGLWLAAFCSLVCVPRWLLSAGFHLSYVAVAAIILGLKSWARERSFSDTHKAGYAIIQVPILAQLGTGPIALYYFKQWPTYFLLTNVLLTPLLPILLFGAWALVILPAGPVLWWLTWLWGESADALYWALSHVAKWPFSSINAEFELHVLLVFGLFAWGLILRARKIAVWLLITAAVLITRIAFWWP
ncbi:ComEC/Rec2 family competence protein [Cryomorphaceae bacterium]|nr:ComEC/Rec2 family competence protein [Cryomorphaceae bacterium]